MLIKVASVLFIFLTLILSGIIVHLFKLQKRGWRSTDIAFPLFALEYYLISDSAFYHSLLPLLALCLSLLAMGLTIYFLKKKKSFYYPKFIKYFWRAGFLVVCLSNTEKDTILLHFKVVSFFDQLRRFE